MGVSLGFVIFEVGVDVVLGSVIGGLRLVVGVIGVVI